MWYYTMINNNGEVTEESNLSPLDKIKIYEYEVERSKHIVDSLEKKLEAAKKDLAEKIEETNKVKKEAKSYLKDLLKEL